ncbi:hypothetical protein D3Y59_06800 [Hymenobacter oligotrophus]|uniref:Uncharacterized protein n=1 Tax=Hymenobacter oligotrophus TaxID=2319843 RepID=A0A3B7R0C3_9BACT|nr:hypothetical protein [Hymenobacter oligotrophus]AYA36790.1 hypothetical protein D3Y59_06800 [Hymenobacter oligotrophus]
MSNTISYVIQADAEPDMAMVTVRIQCKMKIVRVRAQSHSWRLDMPRLLWASMGTEDAADFVTEQYFEAYPDELEYVQQHQIAAAVATSLEDAGFFFGDPVSD